MEVVGVDGDVAGDDLGASKGPEGAYQVFVVADCTQDVAIEEYEDGVRGVGSYTGRHVDVVPDQ